MDPLTITSTVISISARCISTARAVYGLREKYKDAQMTITAIYSETTVISASLGHIQGLTTKDPEALRSNLQSRPELEQTFDQALTGCVLVYSILDDEVQKLHRGADTVTGRVQYLWKEETMKELLQQIRGQQTALTLLIQALQMQKALAVAEPRLIPQSRSSITDIRLLLQNSNVVLGQVAQRTAKIRQAYPRVKAPPSVFGAMMDDTASIYSFNSAATSTNFDFDNDVVNSQAYRRALALSRSNVNLSATVEGERYAQDNSDAETIVDRSQYMEGREVFIPTSIRQKLSPRELATLLTIREEETASARKLSETEAAQFLELQQDHKELREKYMKVKKLYFDKYNLVRKLESELEQTNATKGLLSVEIEELEKTKAFLVKKCQDLEATNGEHQRYFQELELTRAKQRESLSTLISSKDTKIEQLEDSIKEQEIRADRLTATQTESTEKLTALEKDHSLLQSDIYRHVQNLANNKSEIEDLKQEAAQKEEELQRYRGFDAIIEQLKLLSPPQSSSPMSSLTSRQSSGTADGRSSIQLDDSASATPLKNFTAEYMTPHHPPPLPSHLDTHSHELMAVLPGTSPG